MTGVRTIGRGAAVAALGAATVYGHVLYPVYIGLRSRGLETSTPPDPDVWPALSVVVSAYREAAVIGTKLDELQGTDYPGTMEIIVVADDPDTAEASRRPGVRVLSSGERLGKARAVNRGVAAASHDVVVLTDANAVLAPGALRAAARHFTDETVGAVAGEKQVDDPDGAQGFYWKFESWLKRCESATGATIGVVGEMLAFRRAAFRPLPGDTAVDDAWLALDVLEGGLRVVYEPAAYSIEQAAPDYNGEWERRTRIVAGNLDMLWRRRATLVPGALPVTPQLWGHRLVRSSFGPMAHVVLVGIAVPAARHSWAARVFLAGNAVGAASTAALLTGRTPPGPTRLVAQVFFLQAVALGGVRRFLAHDRPAVWPKPERQAVAGTVAAAGAVGTGAGSAGAEGGAQAGGGEPPAASSPSGALSSTGG
ncbi:putative Glycosyl transferase [Frankia canadensis]|uniref:Putative Glycosyl transferase n=1 Tax=Frankia canadensis TaxID=1836972 RepID=A0A2I2L128_9ACTN|nr:glycosyltransferase family 2 protein [Frankia canadensis]SNQ51609.1 putative Glycosyl transferase [Frankia canadensis]SOU58899.1 putative Glycosyl transferase [Frankia canadensis]